MQKNATCGTRGIGEAFLEGRFDCHRDGKRRTLGAWPRAVTAARAKEPAPRREQAAPSSRPGSFFDRYGESIREAQGQKKINAALRSGRWAISSSMGWIDVTENIDNAGLVA